MCAHSMRNNQISHSDQTTTTTTLHSNSHLTGGTGLAGTRMSPFWTLLELRLVVVTTGAIRCAKCQLIHYHQQTNTQFFLQAGCPS